MNPIKQKSGTLQAKRSTEIQTNTPDQPADERVYPSLNECLKDPNFNNLQNQTNFIQSSPQFKLVPFFLQRVNIPGISIDSESMSYRGRNKFYAGQNTLEFNPLSFEMLIDENFDIWLEFQRHIRNNIHKDGTFDAEPFQFTLQLNNSKGRKIMLIEFRNCRLSSIGDIQLDTTSELTQHTLQVDMVYDDYEIHHQKLAHNYNKMYDMNVKLGTIPLVPELEPLQMQVNKRGVFTPDI